VNERILVTKRIVALEGDIVKTLPPWKDKTVRIPEGHVWVEGDAPNSRDSNHFGPLPLGLVNGRIDAILYPHWRTRWVDRLVPDHIAKRMLHHRNNVR
jgi:inner membrane protease subunit 2